MLNKLNPKYIILLIALIASLAGTIILYIVNFYLKDTIDPGLIILFFSLQLISIYSLLYFFVKEYLFRQMKIILKIIPDFSTKSDRKSILNFDENMMHNFNLAVQTWINENKKEIDKYKVLSDYRREFLGDISHELKTPLFSIQGYIHTLLDGAIHDPENNILFLERAAKSTERLELIINDLDMISKLETGEMQFNLQKFNIRNLILDVFNELHYAGKEKNIKLILTDQNKKKNEVFADPDKIWLVCSNLILNSIHYGKKGGFVKVSLKPSKDKMEVTVSDNGIGIPEKYLNRIFDRFYRVESSRARNKGGSGLGLSIVKHVINGHGETISVHSDHKKGSSFTFTIALQK